VTLGSESFTRAYIKLKQIQGFLLTYAGRRNAASHACHQSTDTDRKANFIYFFMNETTNSQTRYAGLFRRLFAIFYDCFLLLAILFVVSAIATALNHGKAIEQDNILYPFFVLAIFSLSYLYFAWFWIHGGQSLGMKTWHIKLQSNDAEYQGDKQINWKIAAIRFFGAIVSWGVFGLGFLWSLIDKKNRSWHDMISKTVLIDLRTKK
jgi:uncharacterized RDD family membrane protein YckC